MPSSPLPQSSNAANVVPETQTSNNPTVPPAASPPPSGPTALVLQPGARPLPDFELVRRLGKGGFGEVWQARGPGGLDFALKFIELEDRGSALEVRALDVVKTIRHPNLVGLSGVWQQENRLILAMELCDRSLQDRLNEALAQNLPGIPLKELLGYMRDAAAGLDALQEHKVQHRDVKPLNLLLMHKGVKVADFGLAKVLEHTVASHTGAMTPAYAAPECFKGEVTHRSDQYSLAVTYYQLRLGRLPFEGNNFQMMFCHINQLPDLSDLPEAERAVVARALAKTPAERWPSCEAFVNALIRAYNKDRQGKKKTEEAEEPSPVLRTVTIVPPKPKRKTDKTERYPRPAKKSHWLLGLALGSLPLLAGGLLLLLTLGYFYGGQIIRIATNQSVGKEREKTVTVHEDGTPVVTGDLGKEREKTVTVHGTVRCYSSGGWKMVERGRIYFSPVDGGKPVDCEIKDGQYSVELAPGRKQVEITVEGTPNARIVENKMRKETVIILISADTKTLGPFTVEFLESSAEKKVTGKKKD